MEWLEKNIGLCFIFVFVLLVILILLGLLTYLKSRKIYRQNNESQITMRADVELSTENSNVTLNINLYNASFKDVTLSQLGFIYKNQRIDFYQEACQLLQRDKIVIGILCASVVARIKITYDGGSSNVFNSALNAPMESI